MGKFRSKLKGKSKGKRWQKGQSSNSNPKIQKYREMAKSRFFQENLGSTGLTQQAVSKHDAMMTYGHKKRTSESENDLNISKEFENMSVRSVDVGTETEYTASMKSGTYKTFQTFASDWSQCSNISFSKLLTRFDSNNALHKEMLAVLAAVTEVIKEQGGKESTTEYFAALMETLKASEVEENLVATLTLLSMGIKSVPQAVLRKQFSDCASAFTSIIEQNINSENGALLRGIIGCLSVILRAQEYALWGDSSTMRVFDSVLAFALHSKPKVRKAGQHAVTSILRGSCFMIPSENQKTPVPKNHPAAKRVAEFSISQIKAEALLSGHRTVLHTLTLLRDVLPVFTKEYIKSTCEAILSLMTHNNVYIKTCCLHTLHALFTAGCTGNGGAPSSLVCQISRALVAARPASGDAGQILPWTTVLQQAYACLANSDLNLCVPNLPLFVNICVSELWLSDVPDINTAATNALKVILMDCVKPAIESDAILTKHKSHIENIFKTIGTGLDNPFNQAIRHVIMTCAVCFEIANEKVAYILGPLLKKLNDRRESHNFHNDKEVEHATGCAVKSLGPEFVLQLIPLRNGPDSINLDRSWLLPVLKEKIQNANLKFFATEILEMATFCRKKARDLQGKDVASSHTYDLLCNQLWALLPAFCNGPKDIKDSFKNIARVLGNVLKDNPEFRLSVMQALRKLITGCTSEGDKAELSRFAKNYLPILLNVYMSPAKGSSGEGQRLAALETIQVYLTVTDKTLTEELFANALSQLETSTDNHFQREAVLDIVRLLVLYQDSPEIAKLFDNWVYPLCETVLEDPKKFKKPRKDQKTAKDGKNQEESMEDDSKKSLRYKEKAKLLEMEHKKAYRILEEIFKSDKESCKQFLKDNYKKIKKLLMNSLHKVADSSKAARLRCIEHLITSIPSINPDSKLLRSAIAESVICTKDINSKCRQCAFTLISTVGNILKDKEGGLTAYLALLTSGLSSDVPRITSASLRATAAALFNYSEDLGLETVQGLMEEVAQHLLTSNREVVASGLSFLKVYTKVLPTDVLSGSLPLIFKTISSMPEDCKRHSRLEIGYFLNRMMRKFGAETVERLVPSGDEVMLRRLRNLRKLENRKQRMRDGQREEESDSDTEQIRGTSKTLEEILKDSDSEMEFLDDDQPQRKPKKKTKPKTQAWIQDDSENIVDLADVSAARKITATDPTKKQKANEAKIQKKKDGGFKTAPDGRLIIADETDDETDNVRPSGELDTDTDDTDNEDKPSKLTKAGTKRRYDDILSVKSGKSTVSRVSRASTAAVGSRLPYRAGGKGIHRPIGSAASVSSTVGTEFKSKKAKGDIKKKGKHDPYAYLPLSRTNLNKRKKAVTSKQFKGVVKSKTKGGKINKKK